MDLPNWLLAILGFLLVLGVVNLGVFLYLWGRWTGK